MYFLPELYRDENPHEYGIIIDLLRNSTMIVKLFEQGISELIPIKNIKSYSNFADYISFGEKNSVRIKGFDFGNSPDEIKNSDFSGKRGIIYSTNGTKAIIKIGRNIPNLLIASMRNMESIVDYIMEIDVDFPVILSGHKGAIALEDIYCGGFLIERLMEKDMDIEINDGAYAALLLYRSVKKSLRNAVKKTEHGKELIWKGFEKDIDIALQKNATDIIPLYHEGIIRSILP